MNIYQISNIKAHNLIDQKKYNNNLYKTEPIKNDTITFKARMHVPRWQIPKANTGLKKLLFGTGLSATALWAIKNNFNFIPYTEEEIIRPMSLNKEQQMADMPIPKKLDKKKLNMYNIPILYDKNEISKLKGDNLIKYIQEKGIKINYAGKVKTFQDEVQNHHYILPLMAGTQLTINDERVIVPRNQVCLVSNDNIRLCSLNQFHHSIPRISTDKFTLYATEKKDEYLQFMKLPYYNEDGNIEIADIKDSAYIYNGQEEYNKKGQLIRTGNDCVYTNYEYNNNNQLVKETYVNSDKTIVTEYSYNNDSCTRKMKAYKGDFEILYNEECFDVNDFNTKLINGYKKDNLTVICLDPNIRTNQSRWLKVDMLKEIDNIFQAESKKNPKLSNCDIFIDLYRFCRKSESIYKPIVTVKDKETGEIISIKQGWYKDKYNGRKTMFDLDNI